MANKKKADKKAKNKSDKTKPDDGLVAPKTITAKGAMAPGSLLKEILATMDDDTRISNSAAKDFVASLVAVVEEQLQEGKPVNLFHLVKVVPRYHTKGERLVNEVFGDPTSKKVKKKYPAKVSAAFKAGSALSKKRMAEILPSATKMQKVVGQ